MSKEVKIIQCARCKRMLYRQEKGDIKNLNGVYGTNTQHYFISSSNCPDCSEKGGRS